MSHITDYTLPLPYYSGRACREAKAGKSPPATLTWSERHWWLAGWNDKDMEMQHEPHHDSEARLALALRVLDTHEVRV